jgi:SAM-dependent methyltransferase
MARKNLKFVVVIHLLLFTAMFWAGCGTEKSATDTTGEISSPSKSNSKMLVYCHPQIIHQKADHFLYSFFSETISNHGFNIDNLSIDTVDVLPGGTIQADAFTSNFSQSHIDEFDFVFLPDCGGPWFDLQSTPVDANKLKPLISEVLKIVKPGGKLVLSKFLMTDAELFPLASYYGSPILNGRAHFGINYPSYLEITKK